MGNNKKTVKCSFCNRLGHNRVSCPKLKAIVEQNRNEFGSSHPDVKEYDEYRNHYSDKSRTNANTKRHCSYCHAENHNIRTCTTRSADFNSLKKINYEWRKNILEEFKIRGIGIGCIMANKAYVSAIENRKSPWTLVSIDWDNLSWIIDNRKVFKLVLISNPAFTRTITLEQLLNDSPSYSHAWEVVSESGTLDFPSRWDSIGDPVFDKNCVEIFNKLTKAEYDRLFFEALDNKPRAIKFLNPIDLGGKIE